MRIKLIIIAFTDITDKKFSYNNHMADIRKCTYKLKHNHLLNASLFYF